MDKEIDPALVEALQRKCNALRERVEELEERKTALEGRVAHLEEVVNPDPNRTSYDQLTKSQKVYRVRKALVEEAAKSNGTAMFTYKEVKWLFDGQPSVGHTYDLMELAGDLDGFNYDENHDENRVTVKLPSVNDETLVHAANKAQQPSTG